MWEMRRLFLRLSYAFLCLTSGATYLTTESSIRRTDADVLGLSIANIASTITGSHFGTMPAGSEPPTDWPTFNDYYWGLFTTVSSLLANLTATITIAYKVW